MMAKILSLCDINHHSRILQVLALTVLLKALFSALVLVVLDGAAASLSSIVIATALLKGYLVTVAIYNVALGISYLTASKFPKLALMVKEIHLQGMIAAILVGVLVFYFYETLEVYVIGSSIYLIRVAYDSIRGDVKEGFLKVLAEITNVEFTQPQPTSCKK